MDSKRAQPLPWLVPTWTPTVCKRIAQNAQNYQHSTKSHDFTYFGSPGRSLRLDFGLRSSEFRRQRPVRACLRTSGLWPRLLLESQRIMGYFQSIISYFGVWWPLICNPLRPTIEMLVSTTPWLSSSKSQKDFLRRLELFQATWRSRLCSPANSNFPGLATPPVLDCFGCSGCCEPAPHRLMLCSVLTWVVVRLVSLGGLHIWWLTHLDLGHCEETMIFRGRHACDMVYSGHTMIPEETVTRSSFNTSVLILVALLVPSTSPRLQRSTSFSKRTLARISGHSDLRGRQFSASPNSWH